MKILKIDIPETLRQTARQQEKTIPKTIKNSILRGGGIYIGLLGELCLVHALEDEMSIYQDNTFQYDVIMEHDRKYMLEVKTKTCAGLPLPYYECSVADANLKQNCDFYAFLRITKDFKTAFLLGCLTKETFMKVSRSMQKGDIAENMKQGSIVQDCHNVYISDLRPMLAEGMMLKPGISIVEI